MRTFFIITFLILTQFLDIAISQTFIREYSYDASENDSKNSARDAALLQVKKLIMEELGVYINSNTTHLVTEDDEGVEDLYKAKTQIISECITQTKILNENWDGKTYYVKAEIRIDKDEMLDRLERISQQYEEGSYPLIEQLTNGHIDWENKIVTVKGFGMANTTFPKEVWKKSAEEAARVDAQAKILELINGFDLESKVFVKNYQLNKDEKIKEIKGRLKYVEQVGATVYPTETTAEVILILDLKNVLE